MDVHVDIECDYQIAQLSKNVREMSLLRRMKERNTRLHKTTEMLTKRDDQGEKVYNICIGNQFRVNYWTIFVLTIGPVSC